MEVEDWYARLPVFAQNIACSIGGYQRAKARFTPHFRKTLAEWERSGGGPAEELHAIQLRRLVSMVSHAQRSVPHYESLEVEETGPIEDSAGAVADLLSRLPVLEKEQVRAQPRSFLSTEIPERSLTKGKTSGTTGSAMPLWYTSEALAEEYVAVWRLRRQLGVSLEDPHFSFGGQNLVPYSVTQPPFWRFNRWGRQTLFSLYHMSEAFLPAYVDAIHRLSCSYVVGYPSSIHLLARTMLDSGRPLEPGRLKGVFPSSESLLAFQRESIEAAFGAPVRDRYGTSEFAVSMTECATGNLHVDMEFGIVEVEVQEQGPGWERGPLIVTGLANPGMPLLRYRIGDVGTRLLAPCACGRNGDVFSDVDGRIEDYVVTPEGRWIGRLDHVFKDQVAIAEAQVLQSSREEIRVTIVPAKGWGEAEAESLLHELRSRLGDRIKIAIEVVDAIPREANGKFRAVVSELGSQIQ